MAAGYFFLFWRTYYGGLVLEDLLYVSSSLVMLLFLIASIQINHAKTAIILHKNVF